MSISTEGAHAPSDTQIESDAEYVSFEEYRGLLATYRSFSRYLSINHHGHCINMLKELADDSWHHPSDVTPQEMLAAARLAKEDLSGRIARLKTRYTAYSALQCQLTLGEPGDKNIAGKALQLALDDLFGARNCTGCQDFLNKLRDAIQAQQGIHDLLNPALCALARVLTAIEKIEAHLSPSERVDHYGGF